MRSSQKTVIIFCISLSIFLNVYLFKKRSSVLEVNCIIDLEALNNFTRTAPKPSLESPTLLKGTLQTRLYAFPTGGLGNKLFELVSLLGLASTLKRTPVIDATEPKFINTFVKSIQPIFPNLLDQFHLKIFQPNSTKIVNLNNAACCKFDNPKKLINFTDENLYLKGNYFQSYKYFHHLRAKIRQWLEPTSLAKSLAGILFPQAMRKDFIICPHIRRGDFKTDGVHEPSDASFTRAATDFLVEHYKKSHNKISVAVLGNDLQFAYTIFQDKLGNISNTIPNSYNFTVPKTSPDYQVLISPSFTPELDLAFSRSYCDVTLITAPSSTFGWWLSYLAKDSATSYYRNITETKDKVAKEMNDVDFFPSDWIMLETDKDGKIKKSKRKN